MIQFEKALSIRMEKCTTEYYNSGDVRGWRRGNGKNRLNENEKKKFGIEQKLKLTLWKMFFFPKITKNN